MLSRPICQEKRDHLFYIAALIFLGSPMAFGGLYVFIAALFDFISPGSPLALLLGGMIVTASVYLVAKGFSRQQFRMYGDGFIPFWGEFLSVRRKDRSLVSWRKVLFVSRVVLEKALDGSTIWMDVIVVKRSKRKVVAHMISPRSMEHYTESTLEPVKKLIGEEKSYG